jgi:hypothetical protein
MASCERALSLPTIDGKFEVCFDAKFGVDGGSLASLGSLASMGRYTVCTAPVVTVADNEVYQNVTVSTVCSRQGSLPNCDTPHHSS